MSALSRHPPRIVRPGAGLWQKHRECDRCAGLETGCTGGTGSETRRRNLHDDRAILSAGFAGLAPVERHRGVFVRDALALGLCGGAWDYVRLVRLQLLSPTQTGLIAKWHFPLETQPERRFDAGEVAAFAMIVPGQDQAAAEMNPRGMVPPAFTRARLMPEEYEIGRPHHWVLAATEAGT